MIAGNQVTKETPKNVVTQTTGETLPTSETQVIEEYKVMEETQENEVTQMTFLAVTVSDKRVFTLLYIVITILHVT